jgi:hypothetical protein
MTAAELTLDRRVARHILERMGAAGVPPSAGLSAINVGNQSLLNVLQTEYFDDLLTYGSTFKLVQAHYGGGKTHFLRLIRDLAWQRDFAVALVELSPNECPYDDPVRVYTAVATQLAARPADPLREADTGLPQVLRRAALQLMEQATDGADSRNEREKARASILRELRHASCESPSFRAAVVQYVDAVLSDDSHRQGLLTAWMMGEAVPLSDVSPLGVHESLGKANGFKMLRSLTQMLHAVGYTGTALLFDEVDRTLSVSNRRIQVIGDNLRQVIDLCGGNRMPNTLFVYAVPPEFMRSVVPNYPALQQRIASPIPLSHRNPQGVVINLEELDLEPQAFLEALGAKLVTVVEVARGVTFSRANQAANASRLARMCVSREFDVNHRRLFVKAWLQWLQAQLLDGERVATDDDLAPLVQAGAAVAEPDELADAFEDF